MRKRLGDVLSLVRLMMCEWLLSRLHRYCCWVYDILGCRPKHAFALLRVLATALGSAYLEVTLETYDWIFNILFFADHHSPCF